MEAFDIDRATPEELVEIAQEKGIDLRKYVVEWEQKKQSITSE